MIATDEILVLRARGLEAVNEREVQEAVDRAVRNEARILTIETTVKAVQEISTEVRKEVRNVVDELRRHTSDDNTRFASVDSRFVGGQSQLTTISQTLDRIEQKMIEENDDVARLVDEMFDEEGKSRLRPLLAESSERREFWHALRAQWGFVAAGAGFASAILGGIYTLLKIAGAA